MRPIVVTVGPLTAGSANAIVTSVTPTSGQSLTLTTSPYVASTPRQVLVTYGAEGTARTLVLTGTDWSGSPISETITVPTTGTTVASVLSYATVTSIVSGSAFTNAITVGTNGVASSPWVRLDEWATQVTTIQCNVSGTVNYTVQGTMDDPNSNTNPFAPSAMKWINQPDLGQVASAVNSQSAYNYTPTFVRVVVNSGTGSVTMTASQAGVVPY